MPTSSQSRNSTDGKVVDEYASSLECVNASSHLTGGRLQQRRNLDRILHQASAAVPSSAGSAPGKPKEPTIVAWGKHTFSDSSGLERFSPLAGQLLGCEPLAALLKDLID